MDIDRLARIAIAALEGAARADPAIGNTILSAARQLVERLETSPGEGSPVAASPADHPPSQSAATAAPQPDGQLVQQLVDARLRLGDAVRDLRVRDSGDGAATREDAPGDASHSSAVALAGHADDGPPVVDPQQPFQVLARRCRLKARAARWQIEREALLRQGDGDSAGDAVAAGDRELIDAARRETDCFLWMCRPTAHALAADSEFEEAAGCYDALAGAAEVMTQADAVSAAMAPQDALVHEAMRLLGEAQSAVRVLLERAGVRREDPDQVLAFTWLRRETQSRGKYVPHLQLASAADPSNHADLRRRIDLHRQAVAERGDWSRQRRDLIRKTQYHARRLENGNGEENDWHTLMETLDGAVDFGIPPSDRELRDLLLPLLDHIPDVELLRGARGVIESAETYRQSVEALQRQPALPPRKPSETLLQARQRLSGRTAILVGGLPREVHRRNIERALELSELHWLGVRHGQSLESEVLPLLVRPETSLVMAMTRFRSHQFGPQLRQWCRQYDKAYVELPAGYGIEQLAYQVVRQLSPQSEALGAPGGSAEA